MMNKKLYESPAITVVNVDMETALLNYSAGTSDPKEGGDPTGQPIDDPKSPPNPFGPAKSYGSWEDEAFNQ